MEKLKISVAICTYNASAYLDEQISSILFQTMLPDEIIIIDDCSSDDTNSIIEEYRAMSSVKIKHIINKNNLGYVKNFEKAISICSGDIIFLSDHDDIWISTKIDTVYNYMRSHYDITMVFTNGKLMDSSSTLVEGSLWKEFSFGNRNQRRFKKDPISYLLKRDTVTGATMAIRKNLVKDIIPFPKEYVHDTWCALIAASKNELSIIPECLINYRIHPSQQIGLTNNKQSIKRNLEQNGDFCIEKLFLLQKRVNLIKCCIESIEVIDEKLKFFIQRRKYPCKWRHRFLLIMKNYQLYFKYASGMFSIMKDIIWGDK